MMELVVRHPRGEEKLRLERRDDGYRVIFGENGGERVYDVDVAAVSGPRHSLIIAGRQHEVVVHARGPGLYRVANASGADEIELMDPLTHLALSSKVEAGGGGRRQVTAYMPGRVVKILVEEGAEVAAGQGLVVLEAMKMENEIAAERAGVVAKIFVEPGQAVDNGDPLFEIG